MLVTPFLAGNINFCGFNFVILVYAAFRMRFVQQPTQDACNSLNTCFFPKGCILFSVMPPEQPGPTLTVLLASGRSRNTDATTKQTPNRNASYPKCAPFLSFLLTLPPELPRSLQISMTR
jgi:hypothetical protein